MTILSLVLRKISLCRLSPLAEGEEEH